MIFASQEHDDSSANLSNETTKRSVKSNKLKQRLHQLNKIYNRLPQSYIDNLENIQHPTKQQKMLIELKRLKESQPSKISNEKRYAHVDYMQQYRPYFDKYQFTVDRFDRAHFGPRIGILINYIRELAEHGDTSPFVTLQKSRLGLNKKKRGYRVSNSLGHYQADVHELQKQSEPISEAQILEDLAAIIEEKAHELSGPKKISFSDKMKAYDFRGRTKRSVKDKRSPKYYRSMRVKSKDRNNSKYQVNYEIDVPVYENKRDMYKDLVKLLKTGAYQQHVSPRMTRKIQKRDGKFLAADPRYSHPSQIRQNLKKLKKQTGEGFDSYHKLIDFSPNDLQNLIKNFKY